MKLAPAAAKQPLLIKDSDTTIAIAIWTDPTVIEAFFMSGRGYWTMPLACGTTTDMNTSAQTVSVFAEGAGGNATVVFKRTRRCGKWEAFGKRTLGAAKNLASPEPVSDPLVVEIVSGHMHW